MKELNIGILGCGNVGGGVAQIISEMNDELSVKSSCKINLKKIVELNPKVASERFNIPINLFCGDGNEISKHQANEYINDLINSEEIDLIVETIGGSSNYIKDLAIQICKAGKHLVSANKALLAEKGAPIFEAAAENKVMVGYEAAVCAAIPIIKTIKESFTGDSIVSISGIMNGTSNYILSMMQNNGMDFTEALKLAQENGYAEADPTLDINGYDAGHKLSILIKLVFGIDISMEQLKVKGVENINKEDIDFAKEIDCNIKLICYAKRINGDIYATVCPMMVKHTNFLAEVNGATNAVRVVNKYSGRHILLGSGAGSLETASSVVADIVYIARYPNSYQYSVNKTDIKFIDARHFKFPYIITFETGDKPGITGLITTAIGHQDINIDTVSHNRHKTDKATFSIVTMPTTLMQIENAISEIRKEKADILLSDPKIIPVLY